MYEVDQSIFICGYIRLTPKSLELVAIHETQILIEITREESIFPSMEIYVELDFEVTHIVEPHDDYDDADIIKVKE